MVEKLETVNVWETSYGKDLDKRMSHMGLQKQANKQISLLIYDLQSKDRNKYILYTEGLSKGMQVTQVPYEMKYTN